jgi:carbamoyltransferase
VTAILGVSALHHDAAAALVVDGEVVVTLQEERLSGLKNDPRLPKRAMRACLTFAGIDARELDAVVFYESPYARFARVLSDAFQSFPSGLVSFGRACESMLGEKLWVLDALAEDLGIARQKVEHVPHHHAHAASAFFASPYERAAILTVDGVGEAITTACFVGEGTSIRPIESFSLPHSLGLVYAALTAWLGFEVNEGEYKVMGLAAYGRANRAEDVARIVRLSGDGTFEVDPRFLALTSDVTVGYTAATIALLGPPRSRTRPWDLSAPEDRAYADVAASLQDVTERALVALAKRVRRLTGADALCLAGGVALNCVANARIAREAGFARVFVQPAAGDAGGALGAAYLGAFARGASRRLGARRALGLPADPSRAVDIGKALGLRVSRLEAPGDAIAVRVARGEILALVAGRSEWGPRALGHRSLIASASLDTTRARLASAIKRREPFRPFAPAVLASQSARYFDLGPDDMTPSMTTIRHVREDAKALLVATTHVDGTARVQTVADDAVDTFAGVLRAMARETGEGVLLNTSLNAPGDPMVTTTEQALSFLLAHRVDALVVEDVLVERP